jgi:hypothetical protein
MVTIIEVSNAISSITIPSGTISLKITFYNNRDVNESYPQDALSKDSSI